MIDVIWETSAKQRQEFDEKFANLVNAFVSTYKGSQPIISWHSDKVKPIINVEFWAHLPSDIQKELTTLLEALE